MHNIDLTTTPSDHIGYNDVTLPRPGPGHSSSGYVHFDLQLAPLDRYPLIPGVGPHIFNIGNISINKATHLHITRDINKAIHVSGKSASTPTSSTDNTTSYTARSHVRAKERAGI